MNRREMLRKTVGAGFTMLFGSVITARAEPVEEKDPRISKILNEFYTIAEKYGCTNAEDLYHPEFVKMTKEFIAKNDYPSLDRELIEKFDFFMDCCKKGIIKDPGVKF